MNRQHWQQTVVSPCETFHLWQGEPLYMQRYSHVLKYHEPGLAPARDTECAFHIDIQGQPAYAARFIDTFGFYHGLAAVRDSQGWFHIHPDGQACYPERYRWCGNFQEGLCPVKTDSGLYFHISYQGQKAYPEQYLYAGDFKDGFAVVCNQQGLHSHINFQGHLLHQRWFLDLDIFHKGTARAKDERGWFHINKHGRELYPQRYAAIEDFYNGLARVETFEGALFTIDHAGKAMTQLHPARQKPWQTLSADMVGFWRTETIATAIQLSLFDYLPGTSAEIAERSNLPKTQVERLLRALWELDLLNFQDTRWHLTSKGQLLTPQEQSFLAAAANMWSDVNIQAWRRLPDAIRTDGDPPLPHFKASASSQKQQQYHRALDGYSAQDFSAWHIPADWPSHRTLIGAGRTAKVWLEKLLQKYPHQRAVLLGENHTLQHAVIPPEIIARYVLSPHSILEPWPQSANAIVLPRVLHYWPDQQALSILKNARQALLPNGKIYLFEMLLVHEHPDGSLLDLNMLAESGGKLRFLTQWEQLFTDSQLKLIANKPLTAWLNMLVLKAE